MTVLKFQGCFSHPDDGATRSMHSLGEVGSSSSAGSSSGWTWGCERNVPHSAEHKNARLCRSPIGILVAQFVLHREVICAIWSVEALGCLVHNDGEKILRAITVAHQTYEVVEETLPYLLYFHPPLHGAR